MKRVFLVFEGDAWLSTDSLVLMGVYDDFTKAILDILEEMSDDGALDGEETRDSVAKMLLNYHETQGFGTNYIIKTANINEWGEI
jgi:hypothetical protein